MKTLLSSTVIAAIVSALVTFMTTRKQTSAEYVTSDRRKWREEIRGIAEALDGANYIQTLKLLNKLKVRINAYGEYAIKSVRCDSYIWELIHDIEDNRPLGEELRTKQRQMIQYLSLMLKYDWERSKSEIRGDISSVCGWFLVVISLIGFSIHGYFFKEDALLGVERNYVINCTWISIALFIGVLLVKWLLKKINCSSRMNEGKILDSLAKALCEALIAIAGSALLIYLGEEFCTKVETIPNITGEIRYIFYTINSVGFVILMIRNMEKVQQEYYLGKAVRKIQEPKQEEKHQEVNQGKLIEKKAIISKKVMCGCIVTFVLLTVGAFIVKNPAVDTFLTEHIGELPNALKVSDDGKLNVGDMLNIEVTLLVSAVATLAIVVAFLQTRYLGANYKYWFFKKRIYCLLPQEMIVIMLLAIAETGIAQIFENGIIALVCFGISWWMFICLHCRVYVAVIKVSRMFEKLNKKICSSEIDSRIKWCDSVYKKLYKDERKKDEHNSYLYEEAGIILNMIETYAEYSKELTDNEKKKELEEMRKNLFYILWNRISIEASFVGEKGKIWTGSRDEEELKLVKDIIKKSGKFVHAAGEEKDITAKSYLWERLKDQIYIRE